MSVCHPYCSLEGIDVKRYARLIAFGGNLDPVTGSPDAEACSG